MVAPERRAAICRACREEFARLQQAFPLREPVKLKWTRWGTSGRSNFETRHILLNSRLTFLAEDGVDILRHEYVHFLAHERWGTEQHDKRWGALARKAGVPEEEIRWLYRFRRARSTPAEERSLQELLRLERAYERLSRLRDAVDDDSD